MPKWDGRISFPLAPTMAIALVERSTDLIGSSEYVGILLRPLSLALFEEGADAFGGFRMQHVFGHHARRVVVGVRKRHFDLAVEGFLADLLGGTRLCREKIRQFHCFRDQPIGG